MNPKAMAGFEGPCGYSRNVHPIFGSLAPLAQRDNVKYRCKLVHEKSSGSKKRRESARDGRFSHRNGAPRDAGATVTV
jgi:hypothetical protein